MGATCKLFYEISQSEVFLKKFWIFSERVLAPLPTAEIRKELLNPGEREYPEIIPIKEIFEKAKSPTQTEGTLHDEEGYLYRHTGDLGRFHIRITVITSVRNSVVETLAKGSKDIRPNRRTQRIILFDHQMDQNLSR